VRRVNEARAGSAQNGEMKGVGEGRACTTAICFQSLTTHKISVFSKEPPCEGLIPEGDVMAFTVNAV